MDARDNVVGWRLGASMNEVREESGMDRSVSEILFGCKFFFLSLVFL